MFLIIIFLCNYNPDITIYVRGDANACVNPRARNSRDNLFKFFINNNYLKHIELQHKTYHHFLGSGESDSSLDFLLETGNSETLKNLYCSKLNSLIDSHHDVIISQVEVMNDKRPADESPVVNAPRVDNNRVKILWDDVGILNYSNLLSHSLNSLTENFTPDSAASLSCLLYTSPSPRD